MFGSARHEKLNKCTHDKRKPIVCDCGKEIGGQCDECRIAWCDPHEHVGFANFAMVQAPKK